MEDRISNITNGRESRGPQDIINLSEEPMRQGSALNTDNKRQEAIVERVIESFSRTTNEVFSLEELRHALLSGKKLTLKYGADVTGAELHIGHAVNLWMYRDLQQLGHKVVFLIGDFTTGIGDPTGKNKLRPVLEDDEIKKNADEFIRQVKMILIDDPEVLEIRRNSEWLGDLSAKELLSLMSMVTHERLLTRDMFRKRIDEGLPIYEHELIYPLLQGYDSVALQSDLTIIGSDQLFNEMMGRFFQERFGQSPQIIITTKITPGIDGGEKQSKSIGNYIGLSHSPREKFGRLMSLPDHLIIPYFEVYTAVPLDSIARMQKEFASDPMTLKLHLAKEVVARYHGAEVAEQELEWFKRIFSRRESPEQVSVITLDSRTPSAYSILRSYFPQTEKSNSEIRRLIQQGGVKVDNIPISNADTIVELSEEGSLVKAGKRVWFKAAYRAS